MELYIYECYLYSIKKNIYIIRLIEWLLLEDNRVRYTNAYLKTLLACYRFKLNFPICFSVYNYNLFKHVYENSFKFFLNWKYFLVIITKLHSSQGIADYSHQL